MHPFRIDIPRADIDALRTRFGHTRWVPELDNDDWSYGVNGAYPRELTAYWHDAQGVKPAATGPYSEAAS